MKRESLFGPKSAIGFLALRSGFAWSNFGFVQRKPLPVGQKKESQRKTMTIVRSFLYISVLMLVAGCSSSGLDQTTDLATSQPTVPTPSGSTNDPSNKDLTGNERLDDFVAPRLPSQVGQSIDYLTEEESAAPYPVIGDAPPAERRLLTEEERKKIEDELRQLGDS